ncbi:uncharacterized protein J4E79_007163 [Alternaria viburni]|uniref:uncharacterized protein n=1 Tax=Alternaria viburni TaxID=566460 RepID=UPI0020C366CF|nr:uncharacterized protein J4E79_007163 [Alternaria viburni]KAI4658181.1 hypothetical protein J4E79_007163 [Alternaria viburni]
MSLLAFAVSKGQDDDFTQRVSEYLEPLIKKRVTHSSVNSQLARLADRLETSPDRLRRGEINNTNVLNLKSEEQRLLADELEKLLHPQIPALVPQIPMEQLEGPQNAGSDEIMADSPDAIVLRDAEKVALQCEIERLREEKHILELNSTRERKRNEELRERLSGLSNYIERLELESVAAKRDMKNMERLYELKHRRSSIACGQGPEDRVVEGIQTEPCTRDARRVRTLYDNLLSYMYLSRDGTDILATISPHQVNTEWSLCQARLRSLSSGDLWGRGYGLDLDKIPSGFFSFLGKLYGRTEKVSIHEPALCLGLIENPNKRNVLKAYAMDNLCERVFQRTDFHDFDKTKCRMLESYRHLIAAATGGFEALQVLDAGATKALLSEKGGYLHGKIVEEEANKIAEKVNTDLAPFFVDGLSTGIVSARQATLRECASILLRLKFELLMANKGYEIHFVEAGVQFDPGTMVAIEYDGAAVEGRLEGKVKFCIYPALVQYDSSAAATATLEDFSAVLLCQKSFYPSNAMRQNREVIARAIVLLE